VQVGEISASEGVALRLPLPEAVVTWFVTDRDGSWSPGRRAARRFRDGSSRHRMLGPGTDTTKEPRDQLPPYDLGRPCGRLARVNDAKTRWKLVWEFLEEYQWEPDYVQPSLLRNEPPSADDERWDALLAACRSIWLPSTTWPRRNGPKCKCFNDRGSPPNWKPSEPSPRRAGVGTGSIPQARCLPVCQGLEAA
jgi:hypothetical protein